MKVTARFLWFALSLVVLAVIPAHAQSDWQVIQNFPSDSLIKVYGQKNVKCYFQSATEEELFCIERRFWQHDYFHPPVRIPRTWIREIHLEHPAGNKWVGMAVAGTAGGIAGYNDHQCSGVPGFCAGLGTGAAGAAGWLFGHMVPIIPGTVIYKR